MGDAVILDVAHGSAPGARSGVEFLEAVWEVVGTVVHGEHRGRTIGFPTANVDAGEQALPEDGVYAGLVTSPSGLRHAAAISVGTNPTFYGRLRTVEAHLLGFDGDLYGQVLTVRSLWWLRGMRQYADVPSLVEAITEDVDRAGRLVAEHLPVTPGSRRSVDE